MKTKIIVLLLILGAVLFSGCAGNEQPPSPEKNATPEETTTPGENVTPVQPETPEENVTVEENATAGASDVSTAGIKKTPYLVRLENYRASASSLEIKKGEAVAWMNMQENPKRPLTLVSEQDLFENTNLAYKRAFAYTFNETGEYNFSIVGQPRMNVNVSVAEP